MKHGIIFFFLLLLFCYNLQAQDLKKVSLVARASLHDGFNVPAGTFFSNTSPVINESGDVAFKIPILEMKPVQGIFFSGKGVVYRAPNERLVSDVSLSEEGDVVFSQFDIGISDGILKYSSLDDEVRVALDPKTGPNVDAFGFPQIHGDTLFFRSTNSDGSRSLFSSNSNKLTELAREGMPGIGKNASYFFRPAFNSKGEFALKIREGSTGQYDEDRPDSVSFISGNRNVSTVLRDQDGPLHTSYKSIHNSVDLSDAGHVVVVARGEKGRDLILWHEGVRRIIASEGPGISEIEYFTPKVNSKGEVAFRAKDERGLRSIFFFNSEGLHKLISEKDLVETDLTTMRIFHNGRDPGFSGNIDLNDQGVIVFHALLQSKYGDEDLGRESLKSNCEVTFFCKTNASRMSIPWGIR